MADGKVLMLSVLILRSHLIGTEIKHSRTIYCFVLSKFIKPVKKLALSNPEEASSCFLYRCEVVIIQAVDTFVRFP